MTDDERAPDRDRDPGPRTGLLGAIRHVLEALADAERAGRNDVLGAGRRSGRGFSVEYGYSGRIGGSAAPGRRSRPESASRSNSATDEDYLVDVREVDGDVLVVADLPGIDVDDLTVGLADGRTTLVIGVDDAPVERIELPWPADDVDSWLHHGVLEIRIVPGEDGE